MIKLSSPWCIYARKVETLFDGDREVKVEFNEEDKELKLFVDNGRKADAIAKLLPDEKTFGNVTIKISVVPANNEEDISTVIKNAFNGNYNFSRLEETVNPFGDKIRYALFTPCVAQYYSDDISEYQGMTTTIYADLAKEIFSEQAMDVYFTTNTCRTFPEEKYN